MAIATKSSIAFLLTSSVLLASYLSISEANVDQPVPIVSGLSWTFYQNTCPILEFIIRDYLISVFTNDIGQAAGLLRLHFHDCFVQGCDASVLLDGSASGPGEQQAPPNLSLRARAFEIINELRNRIENACGRIVSCADILALAARDSVYLDAMHARRPIIICLGWPLLVAADNYLLGVAAVGGRCFGVAAVGGRCCSSIIICCFGGRCCSLMLLWCYAWAMHEAWDRISSCMGHSGRPRIGSRLPATSRHGRSPWSPDDMVGGRVGGRSPWSLHREIPASRPSFNCSTHACNDQALTVSLMHALHP
ncbi:Peroxidase 12 [Hibiscus syriacus]|uniref:Peroxidase n=1 Tax=Hibiscus syriacus TaxID=106335 RepID=A0A6A3BFV1_HIBSY|nr:Peroxidase 12 [Hibiscus syriacus]